jgi:hypothetical protein
MDKQMRQKQLIAATAICLALIVYATLTSLAGRPVLVGHSEAFWIVVIERFSAFAVLGSMISLLLPGRVVVACTLVAGLAIILELLQFLIPSRDPGFFDALQKIAGGITGAAIAQAAMMFLPWQRS